MGEALHDHDVFVAPLVTEARRAHAAAAGWQEGLIDRITALRWPEWRLSEGLCAREATWEDDERLSDLYANASERIGQWDVTVERSPNPYAQMRMQENAHVEILTERGVALGANAFSGRSSIVHGQKLSVGWTGGWRIRNGFRRLG